MCNKHIQYSGTSTSTPGARRFMVLYDHLDQENIEYFGSMKASTYIDVSRTPSDKGTGMCGRPPVDRRETLRSRCYLEHLRLKLATEQDLDGIPVPYTDEAISQDVGVPGRATPGCSASELEHLKTHPAAAAWRAMIDKGMTAWEATRSLHSGPKFFKELARGSEVVLDADRQKSFPNAVRDRHPDLRAVGEWVSDPMACVVLCGLEASESNLKLVKSSCNSAGGSGIVFEREWLQAAGAAELPDWLRAYRQDLRTAAERDTMRNPGLARVFENLGHDPREVQNKVHSVCNAHAERMACDMANTSRSGLAECVRSVSCESDGHPCLISWRRRG